MKRISEERKKALQKEVKAIAHRFRNEYPALQSPIPNSFKAVEELGFFVMSTPAPAAVSGLKMNLDDKTMIVVNSSQPLGRQNFSIWHEVYHWYTGDGQDISLFNDIEYNETENKAEVFASEILLEEDALKRELFALGFNKNNLKYLSKKDLVNLQYKFNVSYRAVLTRIINLFNAPELRTRYGAASNQEKIIKLNKELGFDGSLEETSLVTYISPSLFQYMKSNLSEGKISIEHIEQVLSFIEEEFK